MRVIGRRDTSKVDLIGIPNSGPRPMQATMQTRLRPVTVVGAGALGCLFGGVLARAGTPVTLVGRAPHVAAIRQDGLTLESGGRKQTIPLAATEDMGAVR